VAHFFPMFQRIEVNSGVRIGVRSPHAMHWN
jgi:hypothetical protein